MINCRNTGLQYSVSVSVQLLSLVRLFVTPWTVALQACILSLCLFTLYAECIMRNPGLEETQTGIKIAGRNINNLRYAPRVYPNWCPSSWWCHPTVSSSAVPFSSCPQSFPASGSFQTSQLFASGGQNSGVSPSTSVLPMNTQDRFPLGWTGWISLQSKGLSRVLQYHSSKTSILWRSALFIVQLSHRYMTTGKTIAMTRQTFVDKVMSLLFNMLSRLVITFLQGVSVF